jgi:hypothetical protein
MRTTLKMRELTTQDTRTVADMLASAARPELINLYGAYEEALADGNEAKTGEALIKTLAYVLNSLYADCRDGLTKWFASLYNMEVAEYLKLPPGADIDTIDELITRAESTDFFQRASALFSRTSALKRRIKSE